MQIIHALHDAVEATKRGDHVRALQIQFFAIEQARKVESLLWEHPGSRCRFDKLFVLRCSVLRGSIHVAQATCAGCLTAQVGVLRSACIVPVMSVLAFWLPPLRWTFVVFRSLRTSPWYCIAFVPCRVFSVTTLSNCIRVALGFMFALSCRLTTLFRSKYALPFEPVLVVRLPRDSVSCRIIHSAAVNHLASLSVSHPAGPASFESRETTSP